MDWDTIGKILIIVIGSGGILGLIGRKLSASIALRNELSKIYLAPFHKWCAETYGELKEFWRRYKKGIPNGATNLQIVLDYCMIHEALMYTPRWTALIYQEDKEVSEIFWELINETDRVWHRCEEECGKYLHNRRSIVKLFSTKNDVGKKLVRSIRKNLPFRSPCSEIWKEEKIKKVFKYLSTKLPQKKRREMIKKRKAGILLILISIGIPLVLFFFQDDGTLWLKKPEYIKIERKLTPREIKALKEVIEGKYKYIQRLEIIQEAKRLIDKNEEEKKLKEELEKIKEIIRKEEDYYKEKWQISIKKSLSIPYKYFIGIGIILMLIGIGMVVFSYLPKEEKPKKK